jgi:hypothetical protein
MENAKRSRREYQKYTLPGGTDKWGPLPENIWSRALDTNDTFSYAQLYKEGDCPSIFHTVYEAYNSISPLEKEDLHFIVQSQAYLVDWKLHLCFGVNVRILGGFGYVRDDLPPVDVSECKILKEAWKIVMLQNNGAGVPLNQNLKSQFM